MEGYIWKEALQDGVYQTESWDGQDKNSLEIEMKERDRKEKKEVYCSPSAKFPCFK